MKTTTRLATALAAFGLAILPAQADEVVTKEKAASEATAANTTTVYIVNFKGAG